MRVIIKQQSRQFWRILEAKSGKILRTRPSEKHCRELIQQMNWNLAEEVEL
jgi:hypothetical protein